MVLNCSREYTEFSKYQLRFLCQEHLKNFVKDRTNIFFAFQLSFIKISITVKVTLIFNACTYASSTTLLESIYGIYYFSDFYVSFASAESTLENYVKDSIPLDKNHNKACEQLVDVEKSLSNVANSSNKVSQILCMDEKLPIKFLS